MFRFAPAIDAVDRLGVRDNTYIVFSADNGAQGERWTSNQVFLRTCFSETLILDPPSLVCFTF